MSNTPNNPYSPPVAQLAEPYAPHPNQSSNVWAQGNSMIVGHGATLPKICIKTGKPATRTITKKFTWHPPWIAVTILAGLLVYVILAVILQKRITVELPVSEEYASRRRRNLTITTILCLLGVAGLVVGIGMAVNDDGFNETYSMISVLLTICGGLGVLIFALATAIVGKLVKPTQIDDNYGYFKGAHAEFLRNLPPSQ